MFTVIGVDKEIINRLNNELDDRLMNKISIARFEEIYRTIVDFNPDLARSGSRVISKFPLNLLDMEMTRNRRVNEILQSIASKIKGKYLSYDDFFKNYNFNSYLRTISFRDFDRALLDLGINLSTNEIELLKNELTDKSSGNLDLTPLLRTGVDDQVNTPRLQNAKITPHEKQRLIFILEEINLKANQSKSLNPYIK